MVRTIFPEQGSWILQKAKLFIPVFLVSVAFSDSPAENVLKVEKYNSNLFGLPIEGKIMAGSIWIESGDTNVTVISEIENGKPCDAKYVHWLLGYRFEKRDSRWIALWKIRDKASGCLDLQYFDSTLQVIDVDGNGVAETLFFYSLFGDGTDPQNLKMMLHINGVKAPIRGLIPRTEEDSSAYEMKPDANLKTAAEPVYRFALTTWNAFLSKNFKEEIPPSALK